MQKIWEKALIIDDDETYGNLVEKMLKKHFKVSEIGIRTDAYESMLYLMSCVNKNSNFPDLIIVDIYMPGLDGFDFLDLYKENYQEKFPDTKLVLNTSLPSNEAKRKAEKYDFVSFFTPKPLELEALEALLV